MGIRILHHYRLDTVHPDRQVIGSVPVRLYQCDMDVEVRSHIGIDLNLVRGVSGLGGLDPLAAEDTGAVFDGNQCPAVLC